MYFIYGLIDPTTHHLFHVGCSVNIEQPVQALPAAVTNKVAEMAPRIPQLVVLQAVESHPLAEWVKWSKRFRRDILTNDWTLHRALADAFTNSNRLKRALGEEVPSDAVYQENFHEFDRRNPFVFEAILNSARRLKAEGRELFGMDAIVNELRWDGPGTDSSDNFKINDTHRAYYVRKLQMIDPSLCGLFAMRESVADDLVLDDGRSWRQFALEHSDILRFAREEGADEEDISWAY